MRKTFAVLALAFAALIAVPGVAAAYGGTAAGSVEPGTVTAGGQVSFSGDGFAPAATVTISEDGEVEGTVTASSGGAFSTTVTVEGIGNSVLTAVGEGADGQTRTVTATVRVLAASSGAPATGAGSDGDQLPVTGADGTATQVWAGIGLLGMGAGLVALTVSRRRVSPTTVA